MDTELPLLVSYLLTCLAIEMTPGPNMGYLAILGMSQGRSAGLAATLGVALGLCLLGLLVGVGAGSFLLENRWAYETLRAAGSLYLLWLAYDCWRDGNKPLGAAPVSDSLWRYFRQGLITNLLNPKAAVFFVAVLPKFVDADRPLSDQLLLLVALDVGVATFVHASVVLLASLLQPIFVKPALRRAAAGIFAALLVAVAVWLLL